MGNDSKPKYFTVPIKVIAVIIALMILTRFTFVVYDFIKNPFHEPVALSQEAFKHVMTALILLELFALTLRFLLQEVIDPNLIVITVLTAIGRDLIAINIMEVDYLRIVAIGFIFAIAIAGLYILKKT
ncbi:MAG: phosphate-starvation-inducible PsiE family protein [Nitrospirota bacterium]